MSRAGTASRHLARALLDMGTEQVFTLPSGSIDPFLKHLSADGPEPVVVTNELAAGFMADGYARAKGTPGAALVGGGIAALYMLPAIVNARIEGIPVLAMTGDIPASCLRDMPFQNTAQAGTRDTAVYETAIGHSAGLAPGARSDPWPGVVRRLRAGQPAHLSIPFDVQSECVPAGILDPPTGADAISGAISGADAASIETIARRLIAANRPLIVFGPRVAALQGGEGLQRLLALPHARFTTSVGAIGQLAHDTPGYLGPYGYCGTEAANRMIADPDCDFVLFVGGRPGQRDGARWQERLIRAPDLLARIDAPGTARLDLPTLADIAPERFSDAVCRLADAVARAGMTRRDGTRAQDRAPGKPPAGMVERCIALAQARFGAGLVAFVDSGLHRCAAIRAWKSNGGSDLQMAAEQAPMGWAIAASIGAGMARRDLTTLCITGDGCMRLLGQELATAARYRIRTIFLVVNNGGLGSVVARAESAAEAERLGMQPVVDWVSFASTLGVAGARVSDPAGFAEALGSARDREGAFVIDLRVPSPRRRGKADAASIFLGARHGQ